MRISKEVQAGAEAAERDAWIVKRKSKSKRFFVKAIGIHIKAQAIPPRMIKIFRLKLSLKTPQKSCEKRFAKFGRVEDKPIIDFVAPKKRKNTERKGEIMASAKDLKNWEMKKGFVCIRENRIDCLKKLILSLLLQSKQH